MSESSNQSTNTSSSTSSPTFIETPENSILDQLSQYASGLAQQMSSWADGVYAHTSQITDAAVNNFFNVSQNMTSFANKMTDQYNNTFAPENQQLVDDANSYASPARMQADMGMAGATQAQAGDQAIKNEQQKLLSFGINPGDGSYVSLDKAAAVQNAANTAGAMNMQRNADIATGQKLRAEAVSVGAQLPAAIANSNNTAIQANTGASNASLANANTGVNLKGLADKYLQTAMSLKLPPTGQNSNSQSLGQSSGQSSGPGRSSGSGSSGGAGAGGAGAGSAGGGPAWMPQHGVNDGGGGGISGVSRSQPGPKTSSRDPGTGPGEETGQQDWSVPPPPVIDPRDFYEPGMGIGQPTTGAVPDIYDNPFSDGQFGQTYNPSGQQDGGFNGLNQLNGDFIGFNSNQTYDPSANQAQLPQGWQDPTFNPGADIWGDGANQIGQAPADQLQGWGGSGGDVQPSPNWSNPSFNDYSNGGGGDVYGSADFFNQGGGGDSYDAYNSGGYPAADNSYSDQSYQTADNSSYGGGGGYSDYSDYGGDYARGGTVRRKQQPQQRPQDQFPQQQRPMQNFRPGGNVTPGMSPSRGQQTDDVSAHVNVGEYVVPKDVVAYKGHQFFENLVKQSRKNRAMQGMVQNAKRMR